MNKMTKEEREEVCEENEHDCCYCPYGKFQGCGDKGFYRCTVKECEE